MQRQGGGAIVNISSIAAISWLGVPYVSYAASKAAVLGMTTRCSWVIQVMAAMMKPTAHTGHQ